MKLYWWISRTGSRNLGDEITQNILRKKFGLSFDRAGLHDADVVSTGSVLGWVYESKGMTSRAKDLVVLGSGFMHPWVKIEPKEYLRYELVRGYLTKSLLANVLDKSIPVGDPGILFSEIIEKKIVGKKYRYGIIPHMGSYGNKKFFDRFKDLRDYTYIDIRTENVDEVANIMQQCEVILSQSLHGLIFADSLSIPNVWLDVGALHPGGEFKFYDYFSTVGRPFYKKCGNGTLSSVEIQENLFIVDASIASGLKKVVSCVFEDTIGRYGYFESST